MNLKNILLIGLALVWAPIALLAQDTAQVMRFSLAEAQAYAISNNYSVINAAKDYEMAKKKVWEYTSIGLPQISAAGNYQNTFSTTEFPNIGNVLDTIQQGDYSSSVNVNGQNIYLNSIPIGTIAFGSPQTYTLDLTVSQLIFNGQYFLGLQASKMLKLLSAQTLEKTQNDTKESIAGTYYMVLILQEVYKTLEENYKVNSQTLYEVTQMNKQGFTAETDVDQLKIAVSTLENAKMSTRAGWETAKRLLKFQLGLDLAKDVELTDSISYFIDRDLSSYLATLGFDVNSNIDYQTVETYETLQVLNLKNEKVQYYPTITAFYKHNWMIDRPDISFSFPDMVGVTLNIPIFNSGQKWAKVKQARYNLEKAQNTKIMTGQALIMDFEKAKTDYETALNNYFTLQQNVKLSKKIFDNNTIQFREGMISSLDLIQVQSQYLQIQSNYYNAVLALLNAKAHLDRLMMII